MLNSFLDKVLLVQGVLLKQAVLPCDITSTQPNDAVLMILWFKEGDGDPFYR